VNSTIRAESTEICELPALRLETDLVWLSIFPEPGAKIYDLVWKPTGRQILWQNPRVLPQRYPIDSNFDNYWCGGWDEGFPTCDACEHNGESYPNLGELRSVRWAVEKLETRGDEAMAQMSAFGPITPVRAIKTVSLRGASVIVHYELTNLGPLPIDFIWGSHPALAVTANTTLHIPAETGIVQLSSSPSLGAPGQHYRWPNVDTPGGTTDMSRVQSVLAGKFCGHYATGLHAGAYRVEFAGEDLGLVFRFDREQCPWLWMWLVYGGWRGYHHVIVEPWTSFPVNLSEAVRQNTAVRLQPGRKFAAEVSLTLHALSAKPDQEN
jgi:galactose mutarotase-like enzyme